MIDNVLECFGVGEVLEDKQTNTDEVLVYIPSLFPEADGGLQASVEDVEVTTQSPTGDTHSSKALRSNGTPCIWLPFNTNRITSPDVRKGSKVVVYKFKGTNTYRWMYFGMDGTLRLETIIWAISASPKVNEDSPFNTDNYYIFLISTHTKKFQLLTGQGNGEPTSYAITLDTGNGGFSLVDGEENAFVLNSMEHMWAFQNQEKSIVAIEKKNITATCEDTMLLRAKEKIAVKTKVLDIRCEESMNLDIGEQTNLLSPNIFVRGNVTHEGDTEQTGNYNQTGDFANTGNVTSGGTVTGQSGVKSGSNDLDSHKHGKVQNGNGVTDVAKT
ncbi:hypothetical protein D6_0120 [Aeromonas phage D6]|uniref:Baseplate protein n=1 Tax=Aeromonas phage D6 TaxID=2593322 RepID=A0A514TWE0_9CAUD|nr:baseplate assembly protein [Aeromonas phage D6]QDJ97280.1 hypothetical protein D6_0120 [Aeromonas phage D6]